MVEFDEAGNVVVDLAITASSSNAIVSNEEAVVARNENGDDSCSTFSITKSDVLEEFNPSSCRVYSQE